MAERTERTNELQLALFGEGPIRRGQTERNIAEYPVTLIADRAPRGEQIRRYAWESKDRNGKTVKRSWTIAAAAGQTLPLGPDRDLYVILMQLTLEQGNDQPVVTFSRNELCERLGWAHTGGNYARLKASLMRLAALTVTAENLFVDAFGETVPLQVFSVISDMSLKDERKTGREHRSYIRWSDTMAEQIRTGVLASMDVGFYLSLSTSLCRRLFEYLNKKRFVRLDRDGTPRFRRNFSIRVMHLAHAHLFLSADRPSEVKRQLEASHQELVTRGFLSAVKYTETKSGEAMVVYEYAAGAMVPQRPEAPRLEASTAPRVSVEEAARQARHEAARREREALDARVTPEILQQARELVMSRKPAPRDGSTVYHELVKDEARRLVQEGQA